MGRLPNEIKETRSIDKVQLDIPPLDGRHRCRKRNLAARFFGIVVRGGISVFHPPAALDQAGVCQKGFGKRRLAIATVPDDGDIFDMCGIVNLHPVPPDFHILQSAMRNEKSICQKYGKACFFHTRKKRMPKFLF